MLNSQLVLMSEDSSMNWHFPVAVCKAFTFASRIFKLCRGIDEQTTKSWYHKRENCQKMAEDSREMSKQNWAKELKLLSIKHFFNIFFFLLWKSQCNIDFNGQFRLRLGLDLLRERRVERLAFLRQCSTMQSSCSILSSAASCLGQIMGGPRHFCCSDSSSVHREPLLQATQHWFCSMQTLNKQK